MIKPYIYQKLYFIISNFEHFFQVRKMTDFDRNIEYFDIIYHSLEYTIILITFYHLFEDLLFAPSFWTFLIILLYFYLGHISDHFRIAIKK